MAVPNSAVKQEEETFSTPGNISRSENTSTDPIVVIDLSSSDSGWSDEDEFENNGSLGVKKRKLNQSLPVGFLEPLPPDEEKMARPISMSQSNPIQAVTTKGLAQSRQFWKAGDYEGDSVGGDSRAALIGGLDHVRVHPKFLHSNATSHKWSLGAFAELMDNALDEVSHGATFVNIDVIENKKDGSKMLLVEDNGGGMEPDKMRHCMSLGYSAKSKVANAIGQYGNGFKTSTMRLGADVIVFSRCPGKNGNRPTQSVGMLSYTFLRCTGKEDIVVPMLDYVRDGTNWKQMSRVSSTDWCKNLDTILQWSPYSSEANLLEQFCLMSDQGTIIIIYNLWENENEELELDLNTDKEDIQLRGVNRDEKKIEMAIQFPNSMHFLTYKHSLRSYASILYLRLPSKFRMILRGKDIKHHDISDDMMLKEEITYRPQHSDARKAFKDKDLVATVTIGFVKDAKDHIDVQGFNVYHKNRLIKPFWRVWNAAGSDGRGVIGVLEANFVEPAHDKQGFERTTVLARLEAKLVHMQKQYWSTNCHKIGYAPRRIKKFSSEFNKDRDTSPDELLLQSPRPSSRNYASPPHGPSVGKSVQSYDHLKSDNVSSVLKNTSKGKPNYLASSSSVQKTSSQYLIKRPSSSHISVSHYSPKRLDSSSSDSDSGSAPLEVHNPVGVNRTNRTSVLTRVDLKPSRALNSIPRVASLLPIVNIPTIDSQNSKQLEVDDQNIEQVVEENHILKERIKEIEESMFQALQKERDQNKLLSEKLKTAEKNLEDLNKEQESLIDIFSEERGRRDREEESLRKKLKDASALAQELKEKLDRSKKNVYRKG